MHWIRQLFRRDKPQIPAVLWEACINSLPFLHGLDDEELQRLKALCETLLDRKTFTGAAGFELTDETAVLIAAQAALPVLNLTLDLYRDMAGIIVYPGSFIIPQSEMDEAGVLHEWHEAVSGEAVDAGGAVILSWEDVADRTAPGYNVVIHEFAHKIDMLDGSPNGRPPFLPELHTGIKPRHWQQTFAAAYRDFTTWVDALDSRLPPDFNDDIPEHATRYDELFGELPLDPYAAKNPAEFFAVASEAFFVLPGPLSEDYPGVYELLRLYYRQDPLGR
jgi:Mlc titration factor MtfA (ptsG expression regulator)